MEYSRSYLQSLQEKKKRVAENRSTVEKIAYAFIHELVIAASNGNTFYLYERRNEKEVEEISNKDLIAGFQKIFPDCDITHEGSRLDEGKRIPLIGINWSKNMPTTPSMTPSGSVYSDMPYEHSMRSWVIPQ
jgi:hypothetical protein